MQPYVITIAQQKGGAGKSTLASHLSVAFAKFGAKVALIDTDPQHTIASWNEIRQKNKSDHKFVIEITNSNGWKISNEIAKLRGFDVIVVDSPPHMETETKSVIRAANLVIIPCQPSPNDLWATSSTIEIIKKEGKEMILVLNRCSHHSKLLKLVESKFPKEMVRYRLSNRVAYASAMLSGLTVIETEPNSTATIEILKVAEEIYNLIKKQSKN